MREAHSIAREKSSQRKEKDVKQRQQKENLKLIEIGERVLVRNVVDRGGPGKIRSYWEQQVYVVVDRKGGPKGLVYSIQKEGNRRSRIRIVHQNMLKPVNSQFQLKEEKPNTKRQNVVFYVVGPLIRARGCPAQLRLFI